MKNFNYMMKKRMTTNHKKIMILKQNETPLSMDYMLQTTKALLNASRELNS